MCGDLRERTTRGGLSRVGGQECTLDCSPGTPGSIRERVCLLGEETACVSTNSEAFQPLGYISNTALWTKVVEKKGTVERNFRAFTERLNELRINYSQPSLLTVI